MAFKLLDKATAIGSSNAIKSSRGVEAHTVEFLLDSRAATKITAATIVLQGAESNDEAETGVNVTPALAIGSTPERVANGAFTYRIKNTNYTKAAVVAGSVFTAAHVVSATKYGVIMLYITSAGTIVSRVPAATQTYDTAEEAHDAGDAMVRLVDHCYIGRILIAAGAGAWTANTDDMTNGSDLTTATFISKTPDFYDLASHAADAGEITAGRGMFHVTSKHADYVRVYLSALTGTGEVTVRYTPVEIF